MSDTPAMRSGSRRLRRVLPSDLPFLAEMGWSAAHWRPGEAPPPEDDIPLAEDRLGRYLAGWGRRGDAGFVALDEHDESVGAAWYRLFSREEPGYGFISESIPELSIGVRPASRRRGVGAALLVELLRIAREEGFFAVSLSVERDNPARSLYERLGFRKVGTEGGAWTMRFDLP